MAAIAAPVTAMTKLLCVAVLLATATSEPLRAQQPGPNYPVLTLVFAAGAVGGFVMFKNTPSCTARQSSTLDSPPASGSNASAMSPTPTTNCDSQQLLKDGALAVGIACAAGFVWSLLRINRVMNDRSGALITTSPHSAPVIQPPDFSYSATRRDLRVLLVHATF
jgi:hypothetical protein